MNELTFAYKDEAFTNSLIIADGTGIEHNSVQKLIMTHKKHFEELGRVRFEIEPLMTKGGIQKVKICRLNEQQATFLITLMRNTPVVVEFKKELVKQFFEMREFIRALVDSRKDYAIVTEQIAQLHENPKPYHFSNEINMINKLATGMSTKKFREVHNIPKGESIRPYMTAEQLKLMDKLQRVDVGLMLVIPEFEKRKLRLLEYAEQNKK